MSIEVWPYFSVPADWSGDADKIAQLTFGACGYETRVWLNGRLLKPAMVVVASGAGAAAASAGFANWPAAVISSAMSARHQADSSWPLLAAMLNHLCASIRSMGAPAVPVE